MSGQLAFEHNGQPVSRDAFYAVACDPRRSVVVEACAGAGKTWMLVSRILRALLAGVLPHEILAITFTRKAAGEMRQRLQGWLAEYSALAPEALADALRQRGLPLAGAQSLAPQLKSLHAQLLEAGRGVQVRTFHGWFAGLLRNAPLAVLQDMGLPPAYELLEDDAPARALVWRRFFAAVEQDAQALDDFRACVAVHGRTQALKALDAALSRRTEFVLADAHGRVAQAVPPMQSAFPAFAGAADADAMLALPAVRDALLAAARALGAATQASYSSCGAALERAVTEGSLGDAAAALLTQAQTPRKFNDKLAGIDAIRAAQRLMESMLAARCQHEGHLHHERMTRLSRLLLQAFSALKRERGWVDMNDVELAAARLLADPVLSGWVQERLDAQVKQLLIDEFQDTNPLQWQALDAWLGAYAGAGNAPGVLIVGDPKQSIYRFRRAEPQVFRAAQAFVRDGLQGDLLSCDHTRRCAQPVVDAVNAAMAQAQGAGEYEGFRAHTTESRDAGAVLKLPQVPRPERAAQDEGKDEGKDGGPAWRDSLTTPRELPEERLIALESRQAARWIASCIAGGTRPGQVMVLARKRDRLAAMEEELRALHVPAQQPERSDLCEQPEVMDIVALLDVLVSPAHDLSLARALKSPLFGVDDDALVHLALLARTAREAAQPRPWLELLAETPRPASLDEAARVLPRWKTWVEALPPHDALEAIYQDGDVLARFAAAAPPALRGVVTAGVRGLLGAALAVEEGRYLTPYAFVRALKAGGIEAPSPAHVDAVRLLTVHGAKGLEASVVLLLDTDPQAQRAENMSVIVEWPGEEAAPTAFAFVASEKRAPPTLQAALAREEAERRREELNALYVAMTRASHQLVLSSLQPRAPDTQSWWRRVQGLAQETLPAEAGDAAAREAPATFTVPVLPGTFEGDPLAALAAPAVSVASLHARIGNAMHRLLERHPGGGKAAFDEAQVQAVAREFGLPPDAAQEAGAMASRILSGDGAWAWDAAQLQWQGNEVPITWQGAALRMDRLVQRKGGEWWILDYKTRARPQDAGDLVEQLRQYRLAVSALQPGAVVKAAFLTPQGALVAVA